MANFRVEMISGGGLGRTDQESLDARVDHDPGFFVRIKVQRLQTLNHLRDAHLFVEVSEDQRFVLAVGTCDHLIPPLVMLPIGLVPSAVCIATSRSASVKWGPRSSSLAATRSRNTPRFSTGKLPAAVMTILS